MNIFVLNTGRCGSTTFIRACQHISNFASAHESRSGLLAEARFDYPANHIEADNRLSWLLGRLEKHYGDNAFYVHLRRNDNDVAKSYVKRYIGGIIYAYRMQILMGLPKTASPISLALDYCDTINSNVEIFMKDKTQKMEFQLENAKQDFRRFWELIGAEGDIDAALLEFDTTHNASEPGTHNKRPLQIRILRKLSRLTVELPRFLKEV